MVKIQVPQAPVTTINTNNVWDRIVKLEGEVGIVDGQSLSEQIQSVNSSLADSTTKLNNKVRYRTPFDYGCKGDGVTDDSENFLNMLNDSSTLPIKIPVGTFLIATNQKLPLKDMVGESQTRSIIKFTHQDGGFIKYNQGSYNGYGGFGNISNFQINGNGTCNYLITVGYGSEGICDEIYFANALVSAIKVEYLLELVFFENCTGSGMQNFIYVNTGAYATCLNANFINGGNFFSITNSFISAVQGGNFEIFGAWFEQVVCLFNKNSTIPFSLKVHKNRFLKTTGTNPLFNLSCKGQDSVIFTENTMYFGTVNTTAIFNIFASGDNSSDFKTFIIKENEVNAGAETNLTNIFTVDPLVTGLSNIRIALDSNNISFTFSWWNNIVSKFTSGVKVSGIDDVKSSRTQFVNKIAFSVDNQSILNYDPTNKQLYTSDSGGTNILPLSVFVSVPASATATGLKGQWSSDGTYLYICHATNTWKRVSIATW